MFTLLILTQFTIVLVNCERLPRLMKSNQVYVPMVDSEVVHHEEDDDPLPDEDITTMGIRDYINDDLEDDPLRNKSKAQKYVDPDDSSNYVNLPYRPTKQMPVINSSGSFMISTDLQPIQNDVQYSDEPWPTITLSTFDVIVPNGPTWPAKTSPPSFRSHFPELKSTPGQDSQKRNVSRDPLNFTTERASKFDVGILDRFIYPEDYVLTTIPLEYDLEVTGVPTFLARSTPNLGTRPTLTWFNRPKEKNNLRVVLKFTDMSYNVTPSRTTRARNRFSVQLRKVKGKKSSRPILRQKKTVKWLCYECGLTNVTLGDKWCHDAFDNPDGRYYGMRRNFMKLCPGQVANNRLYGTCFKRYLDVGGMYDERGCRTIPPIKGKTYASKRFLNLEKILKNEVNKCIVSPYAILTPFSRAVYLYARFHVCVCKGKLCNASSREPFKWTLIVAMNLVWYMIAFK